MQGSLGSVYSDEEDTQKQLLARRSIINEIVLNMKKMKYKD